MAVRSAYRGSLGASRKELVHATCRCGTIAASEVYVSVDVTTHADLGQKMRSVEDSDSINRVTCQSCGEVTPVHVPVVYHDPERETLILVIPSSQRHRELSARMDLLESLDDDPAPIPAYVKDFKVAYASSGLRALLSERDEVAKQSGVEARRSEQLQQGLAQLESERTELSVRSAELELLRAEQTHREQELARRIDDHTRREQELLERVQEVELRVRELDQRSHELEQRALDLRTAQSTARESRVGYDTEPVQVVDKRAPSGDRTVVVPFSHTHRQVVSGTAKPGDQTVVGSTPSTRTTTPMGTPSVGAPTGAGKARSGQMNVDTDPYQLFGRGEASDTAMTAPIVKPLVEPSADSTLPETPAEALQVTELDVSEAVELMEGEVVVIDVPVSAAESPEPALKPWIDSGEPACVFVDGAGIPRVCVCGGHAELEMLTARNLDLRVQLHRLPSYPLIAMVLGSPDSLRGQVSPQPLAALMNIDEDAHRRALKMLARSFTFHLDVFNQRYGLMRRRRVTASLEDNAQHLLDQAAAYLANIPAKQRSLSAAVGQWARTDYDRYGWRHSERSEFREDKLTDLTTAQTVRRALAICNRFSKPDREDYLFNIRGYPLRLWHRQRKAVLSRSVEFGIWMGQRLAPIAIREGLARSHDELIGILQNNFTRFRAVSSPANDLDEDAASDNWTALSAQASSLENTGTTRAASEDRTVVRQRKAPRTSPIASSSVAEVSGTIGSNPRVRMSARSARNQSVEELIEGLRDPKNAVESAIELARRREARTIEPIMATVSDMNRTDAVRVLSALPSFGDQVTHWLTDGLAHNKGFIRQGCALALAVLRNETAMEAVADQVISEPTQIWKEMARGIGTVGPSAIMPLVSRLSKNDEGARERVAWALAHIAARGGKRQVTQVANGRDAMAAGVARHALELENHVKRDDLQVRGRDTPKEQTVNRAFSRRFFQALEASAPVVDALADLDPRSEMSSPAMLLDEADLLEASEYEEDAAEMLDESDLIPT